MLGRVLTAELVLAHEEIPPIGDMMLEYPLSPGGHRNPALIATVLWVLDSVGFSLSVNNFGSYNKTYGTLAGVIVFLLWLYLTSYMLGAEINAESEKQTAVDTTVGKPLPMGQRHAVAADTLAEPADPRSSR